MAPSRATDELRPIKATYNLVSSQDSSSTLSFGQFRILTSIQGPTSVQIRQELTDQSNLSIQLTPLNGISNLSYTSFSQDLIEIFKNSLLLNHFPRSLFNISSQILSKPKSKEKSFFIQNSKNIESKKFQKKWGEIPSSSSPLEDELDIDMNLENEEKEKEIKRSINNRNLNSSDPSSPPTPSEKSLTINSIQLSLLNSGPIIGSKSIICSIACAVLKKSEIDNERNGNSGWRVGEKEIAKIDDESLVILLDPTPTEENLALSTHVFAFSFSGRKVGKFDSESNKKRRRLSNLEVDEMKIDSDIQRGEEEEDEEVQDGEEEEGINVELVYNESLGRVDMDSYEEILNLALKGSKKIYQFMRSEMEALHRQ